MAGVDMRSFRDPLAPVRSRREWQLDLALANVAALQAKLADCRLRLCRADEESATQAARARAAWTLRGDPRVQSGLLNHLAALHRAREHVAAEGKRLEAELADAKDAVVQRSRSLEALVRLRADALVDYRVEQQRKHAAQADQDWTMRAFAREGNSA